MSIFKSIKNLFSGTTAEKEGSSSDVKVKYNAYVKNILVPRFTKGKVESIIENTYDSWDDFFKVDKTSPKLIGFEKRSRKKFRHLYHSDQMFITEAAKTIEIVSKDSTKVFSLKGTKLEKMSIATANDKGIIFKNKEVVALLDFQNNTYRMFEFTWQPFNFSMGKDFWLVGTRETYDGPGELYCFGFDGNLKWGVSFKEKMGTMFGEIAFMPYLLDVSADSSDILVGSMDRLYHFNVSGGLEARIAISELKEQELQEKYNQLQRSLSAPPKTEEEAISAYAKQLATQFSMGFERMTFNSPYAGFTHDPSTDTLFILEEKGRISAWSDKGELIWLNTFKNEGRFIKWLDEKLIVSFKSGETFWLNREGKFIYGAKLPKQASTISLIPNQNKYVVVSEDNRLYELEKDTGNLITGSEGHPGMELFNVSGHNVFFDGPTNSQGYFWLAPENHQWKHFESKDILDSKMDVTSDVALEITEINKFKKLWSLKNEDDWFGSREVDLTNERIYLVEKGPRKSIEEYRDLSDKQREKDRLSHYLSCYDKEGRLLWKNHMHSTMRSLYLSPDKEYLFTSAPSGSEITYLPGYLYVFDKEGKQLNKFKVNAHGFDLEFISTDKALVRFSSEKGEKREEGVLSRNEKGKCGFSYVNEEEQEELNPFGAGLNELETESFKITRTDKKKYLLESSGNSTELKLTAAMYEATETKDNLLITRSGTRLISIFNKDLKKVLDIKESENIVSVVCGDSTIAVATKGELRGYNFQGELIWRYASIPKGNCTNLVWIETKNVFVWVVSSNVEKIVASINKEGKILNSHSFNSNDYHRAIIVDDAKGEFVAQTNGKIEVYEV
ncbi:ornithine cyclodeaminase [Sutcliffiella horikoshii]|uniref:Ornithine cyclodeaminase n=1 Tax=Sutcliffiella horikoshii TaxID=79883 RepID=A0A5D4T7Y4_9BACI|nr:ornithine cyclodeaminase [Sutcliffiella horikoshii]TYS71763.1 ornithine cyclodeaminase [Sutcliffiella horikoshii]